MAFKTDSIKLKNYADATARDAAITSAATGDIALTAGALQVYNTATSSWSNVDSAPYYPANEVLSALSGDVVIPASTNYTNVTYYVTADQDADNDSSADHAIKIKGIAEYGLGARVEIINGSGDELVITKNVIADVDFKDPSGSTVSQITIDIGKRALFLKTSAANWQVIILTL